MPAGRPRHSGAGERAERAATGVFGARAAGRGLTGTALKRFGEELNFAPRYDAIYLQWLLALYGLDGNAGLYRLAAVNAGDAQARAANSEGLYLLSWLGEALPAKDAEPEMLQTEAATTSLFAWLSVYSPPSGG